MRKLQHIFVLITFQAINIYTAMFGRRRRRVMKERYKTPLFVWYLKRYLPKKPIQEAKADKGAPDTIWQFWYNPPGMNKTPDIIKACQSSAERHRGNMDHKVLDEDSLREYIDLPEYIWDKKKRGIIRPAHFVDIIRAELLFKYGGIWMDPTGFMTAPVPQFIIDSDFFVFHAGSHISPYSFIQNYFIRSRRGAYLIAAWREMILEYWKHENHALDYFVHQLLFKTLVSEDLVAKKHYEEMPNVPQDQTHLVWAVYDKPFDAAKWAHIENASFFQKLTYRMAKTAAAGSFFDVMTKMYSAD